MMRISIIKHGEMTMKCQFSQRRARLLRIKFIHEWVSRFIIVTQAARDSDEVVGNYRSKT